jgi:NAD(P)-dependent dehydrogenase (short-subunit alcohol dehydrogenase family)
MKNESHLNGEKPLAIIASSLNLDGYFLAKQFAKLGYDLIVAASNPSVVEEAQEFKELGVDAVSFQLDLSTNEGVEQLYRRIIATGRPVDAIVINAGLSSNFINEKALAKKVLKDMSLRGYGKILFASSDSVENTTQAYETIFEEAKGSGVTVIAVKDGETELYFLKQGYEESGLFR